MQRGIQIPLTALVNNTRKVVFKDQTMVLIIIGQNHSISMQDNNNIH